jgi:succinylglutamic semialdehyde dehydrogenase
MGGNNAAVIMPDADLRQATIECVRSAFVTTGQRCTCTRRLIVHESVADRVIRAVCNAASNLIVENSLAARADHPAFLGPLICKEARDTVLAAQDFFRRAGARSLLSCEAIDRDGWFLTPGVMRVDHLETGETGAGADIEVFGPLLRVCTVTSLADAIKQANATRFGLAAAIFSRDEATVAEFARSVRAGCVNINTGTAGASSKLPFGGLGHSGNHRPAGSMSLDYCAYPVAGIVESGGAAPIPIGMRFEDSWIL